MLDDMRPLQRTAVIAMLPWLAGCASVTSGTSQKLTVATDPTGADCKLTVKDVAIGTVSPTPGSIAVKRAGDSIRVICSKDGYRDATYLNKPGLNAATLGNIILGGVVGLAVDAASGANNKYEEVMTIRLEPTSAGEPKPEPGSSAPEVVQPNGEPGPLPPSPANPTASFQRDNIRNSGNPP